MFPTALVAIDFSPASEHLLQRLHHLQQLGTEKVLLVHVMRAGEPDGDEVARLAMKATDMDGIFEIDTLVTIGNPADRLLEIARERDISLIVLASRDHSAPHRVLMGSTAAEVVRRAECAVLLENAHSPARPDRRELNGAILLATDGSDSAESAERLALELGRSRKLKVLNVVDHDELEKGWRDLERVTGLAAGANISVHRNVSTGRPGEEIARIARIEGASLILVGRRGRNGLSGLRLGSTAETVCRVADRPVLLLPRA